MNNERVKRISRKVNWMDKEQIHHLDKMDAKLQEMKKISEYAANHVPTISETEKLNAKIKELQFEYTSLEVQRKIDFHQEFSVS